jgi:pectin methylesterase-like acyl-CoA thioesterase
VGAGYTAKKAALVSGVEDTLASQVASFANQLSTASTRTIVVDKSGKGNYKTVQAAVNSVKNGNSQRVIIQINAGTYK